MPTQWLAFWVLIHLFKHFLQVYSLDVVFGQLFSVQRVRPFRLLWCLVNYFQYSESGPFGLCGVWSTIFSSASQALLVVVVVGQLFSVQRVRPFWSLWCLVNYFQFSGSGTFGCCDVWSTIFSSASQALSVVVVFGQLFSVQRVRPFWLLWCLVNYFQFSESGPFSCCGVWSTIVSSASQALLVVVVFGQVLSVQRVRPFRLLWCLVNYFQFSESGRYGCCGVWSTIFSSASQALSVVVVFGQLFSVQRVRPFWSLWCLVNYFQFSESSPFGYCGVWSTIFSSASQALLVVVVFGQLFSVQRVRHFRLLWCMVNYFQFSESGTFGCCGVWSTIFSSASQALSVVVVFGQRFSVKRVRPFRLLSCLVNFFQFSESGTFGCCGVWSTIFSSAGQALSVVVVFGQRFAVKRVRPFRLLSCLVNFFQFSESGTFGCCGVWSTIFSSDSQALSVVVMFGQLFSVQRVRPFRFLWCLVNVFQFSESDPFGCCGFIAGKWIHVLGRQSSRKHAYIYLTPLNPTFI